RWRRLMELAQAGVSPRQTVTHSAGEVEPASGTRMDSMKRALHVGAAMVASLLLGAAAASAQVVVATATLGGGEETPILLSGAAGTAEVAVDTVAREFAVTLRIFNVPTTTTAG